MNDLTCAVDVDGCLANFIQHIIDTAENIGINGLPNHWTQWRSWRLSGRDEKFERVLSQVEDDHGWWLDIPPHDDAHLSFEPDLYITSRSIPSKVTKEWIEINQFPSAPVKTVGVEKSKVPAMNQYGVDLLVDDKPETFDEVNQVDEKTCLLMNRPWNENVPTESGFYIKEDDRVISTDLRTMFMSNVPIWVSEYGDFIRM